MQDIFTLAFPQFFFLVLESGLGQRTRYPPASFFKTFEMKLNLHFSVSAKKEILCSFWSSLKVRKSLKQFFLILVLPKIKRFFFRISLLASKWNKYKNAHYYKVHIFWEGHKVLRHLHQLFVLCTRNFVAFSEYINFIR